MGPLRHYSKIAGTGHPRLRLVNWDRPKSFGPGILTDCVEIRRQASQVRPDVIHLHSARAGMAGRLRRLGYPIVFQPHAWSFEAVEGHRRSAALLVERGLAGRTDGLALCSTREASEAARIYDTLPHHAMVANTASVPLVPRSRGSQARAKVALNLPEDCNLGLFLGRLTRQKAPDRLREAWRQVLESDPEARLLLVGETEEDGGLGLPGVTAVGFQKNVAPYLDAADCLLHLARWEGLPIAILDAMARGLPCVASRESISADELGDCGLVVDGEDSAQVAGAFFELLEPTNAARASAACYSMSRGRYSREAVYSSVHRLYEAVSS